MTNMPPIHPGEHLAEMLEELEISQYRLAKTMGTPARRINEIIHGNRSITADTALRLGQALGMTPEFWLNLQRMYDLDVARSSTDVRAIPPPLSLHSATGWQRRRPSEAFLIMSSFLAECPLTPTLSHGGARGQSP